MCRVRKLSSAVKSSSPTYLRCPQLGLALLVEAAIGGTTIAWVSMSTTLHMQTRRARKKRILRSPPLACKDRDIHIYYTARGATPHDTRQAHLPRCCACITHDMHRRALAPQLSGPSPCLVRRTSGCRSAATPPPDRRRATRGRPRCSEDHPTRYVYNARGPHGLPACCNDPGRVTLVHRSILYMNKCTKKMIVCACLFSAWPVAPARFVDYN